MAPKTNYVKFLRRICQETPESISKQNIIFVNLRISELTHFENVGKDGGSNLFETFWVFF